MSTLTRNSRPLGLLAVAFLLGQVALAADWLAPKCDARLTLEVRGDVHHRNPAPFQAVVRFHEVLGAGRTLAAGSLKLFEPGNPKPLELQVAEDPELRFASGNPTLRLRWAAPELRPFALRRFGLYFRTTRPGARDAWRTLSSTFTAEDPDVVVRTSFEKPRAGKANATPHMLPWGRPMKGDVSERKRTTEQARTGRWSLKIARVLEPGAAPNSNRMFWRMWPPTLQVTAGQVYQFGVWVKMTKCPGRHHASVSLQYLNRKRSRAGGRDVGYKVIRGPMRLCDWTYVHGSLAAPSGAAYVLVNLNLGTQGEVYFDDLTIRPVPGSVPPPPRVSIGRVESRADALAGPRRDTSRKRLVCGVAERPPKLDGVLDDPCWAKAGAIEDFVLFLKPMGVDAARRTSVRACADRDAVYFAFDCEEPRTDLLVAKGTGRDGNIWHDDIVELFLDTNRDNKSFYQIAFNAKGALFDQDIGLPGLPGESWNGPITVATKIEKGRWTAEARIGFVGVRLADAAGSVWTGQFARTIMRGGVRTLYVWSEVRRNFGEPDRFGEIVMPFDPTANAVTARPLLTDKVFSGKGEFPVAVRNNRPRPVPLRLVITAVKGKTRKMIGSAQATAAARSETIIQVPCRVSETGDVRLDLDLREQPTDRLLYATSAGFSVKPPLTLEPNSTLSYLGDKTFVCRWRIGLHESRFAGSRLALSVRAKAGGREKLRSTVRALSAEGGASLDTGALGLGDYELVATLATAGRRVATERAEFSRIQGPFDK